MNRVMHLEIKKRKIFVRRLGKNIDEEILRKHFSQFGEVESVSVLRSFKTKQSRRVGYVIFTSFQGATNAIEFQGDHVIEGKKIEVEQCLLVDEIKSQKMSKGGSVTENSITGLKGGKVSFISLDEHRIERKDLMFQQALGSAEGGNFSSFSPGKSKFFDKAFNFDFIQEEEEHQANQLNEPTKSEAGVGI